MIRPQCCCCKHIVCNPEWDDMLDCDLALEETGEQKCWTNGFNKFELETNDKLVFSYVKAYCEEYRIKEMLQLYKLQQKEKTDGSNTM